jgi:hypothetical protein
MAICYRSALAQGGLKVDSLVVTTQPSKLTYIEGESVDLTGAVITATAGLLSGNVVSAVSVSPSVLTTPGTQTVTVSYGGEEATFTVTVEAVTLSITSAPTKTAYVVGETLDLTGIQVTATAGGVGTDVTSECTFSPADGSAITEAGTITITATFGAKTATTTVTAYALSGIAITTQPTKTAYIVGDSLDLTGIAVTATAGQITRDVTADCTFSPANGSTLSTAGSVTITASFGGFTATTSVTAYAISGISITMPPTKLNYKPDEQLDLTGIVVTATAGTLTRDVTSLCTFNPADGTTLSTEGTFTLTASYLTFTDTVSYEVKGSSIYGVQWGGTSSPAFTRTDDAASFADPQPYYAGMSGTPSSPFDSCMPWSGMEIVDDAEAGKLVKIPKFWFKWTRSGSSMKLQISDSEQPGFHVSPAHADRGDGSGERDYVYAGRYHCGSSNYKSVSGVTPAGNMTRAEFRTAIHNLGSKIWQQDFDMWWTINMLILVEFASWNSQAKIGGGCSEGESTSSAVYNMGTTDNMPYHTGTVASSIGATVYGANQYRYIENWWGNVFDWIDGIYFSDRTIYAIKNPANFSDDTGGTNIGTRANASGVVTEWTAPSASGFEYALYPAAVTTDNNYETYDCDNSIYNASGVVLCGGGYYNQYQGYGAFCLYGNNAASSKNANRGSRLQKLP